METIHTDIERITKRLKITRASVLENVNFMIDKLEDLLSNDSELSEEEFGLSIETLFKYVDPEDANLAPLFEKNLKELESWDFKFAYTPQFELSIGLTKENSLILGISNGLVKEFRFSTNEDDSIKNHIGKLIGVKFIKTDLVNALLEDINLELFNSNENFKHILEFINKNIS